MVEQFYKDFLEGMNQQSQGGDDVDVGGGGPYISADEFFIKFFEHTMETAANFDVDEDQFAEMIKKHLIG